jgi:hypothetical protein
MNTSSRLNQQLLIVMTSVCLFTSIPFISCAWMAMQKAAHAPILSPGTTTLNDLILDRCDRTFLVHASACSTPASVAGIDELNCFTGATSDALSSVANFAPLRFNACGLSEGGLSSQRLGIALNERIAAMAPLAANMPKIVGDESPSNGASAGPCISREARMHTWPAREATSLSHYSHDEIIYGNVYRSWPYRHQVIIKHIQEMLA